MKIKDKTAGRIILIGFMGSGKSTVGVSLAEKTGLPLTDTDQWIVNREGADITQIFKEQGEAAFRLMETNCLTQLLQADTGRIISAGGGIPVREENQALIRQLGTAVYLYTAPEEICRRLREDRSRPLLQGDDPAEKIRQLWEERESDYRRCADIIIDTGHKEPSVIAGEIIRKVWGESNL